MLQLTDEGAKITLIGQSTPAGDGLFWFGSALLIGAVAVAMAMSLLPERLAIGALALLVVGSFIFNVRRQQQKKAQGQQVASGVLWVRNGEIVHDMVGKRQHIVRQAGDTICQDGNKVIIRDETGKLRYCFLGFEDPKEVQILLAVFNGQSLNKRHANIKMQSN